jgi:hypothetical protein
LEGNTRKPPLRKNINNDSFGGTPPSGNENGLSVKEMNKRNIKVMQDRLMHALERKNY